MKTYRNVANIKSKDTLGRRFSLAGLVILALGFVSSFMPSWLPPAVLNFLRHYGVLVSFGSLAAGFACASLGSYYINRYARRRWPDSKTLARLDEVLERNMKGFDDKFAYFVHSLPKSNYVVVGPCGLLIFAIRGDDGRVLVKGDQWTEPFSARRLLRIFAREGVGNPPRELAEQASKLREFLSRDSESKLADVPIEGAVVFINSAVQLELDSPSVPVLRADQVKEYIRRKTKEVKLPTSTLRALTDYMRENSKYQEEQE